MKHRRNFVLALLAVVLLGDLASSSARAAEKRIALVVGNANYASGALPTPANDAGLIAQTLQAAGFDVVGVRALDQNSRRRTFRILLPRHLRRAPIRWRSSTSAVMDCSWKAKTTSSQRMRTLPAMRTSLPRLCAFRTTA